MCVLSHYYPLVYQFTLFPSNIIFLPEIISVDNALCKFITIWIMCSNLFKSALESNPNTFHTTQIALYKRIYMMLFFHVKGLTEKIDSIRMIREKENGTRGAVSTKFSVL